MRMTTLNSKLPVPQEGATDLEKLQFELAVVYSKYQETKALTKELEKKILKFQGAFGAIDSVMQSVVRE